MTSMLDTAAPEQRRKARRNALLLGAVAFLFYVGFIAVGILNS